MSGAEVTKRRVPKVNMSTTNDSPTNHTNHTNHTTQSRAKARTVTWQEISEWQFDNKYILSGYRPEKADYLDIFTSLTFLHNETLQCVHSSGRGSSPATRCSCLPAVPRQASISQCLVRGLLHVWNLLLVCRDLFGLEHTLPPDATPLASRRTVLAWTGSAGYCHCDSGHILFRHLLYVLL